MAPKIFSVQINRLDPRSGNSLFFYRCSALNIEDMRPVKKEIDSDLCHRGESKADLPHWSFWLWRHWNNHFKQKVNMSLFVSSTTDWSECWKSQEQSFLLKKLTIVLKIGQYKGTWRMTFLKYYLESFLLNWSSMNIRNPFVHLESKTNEFYSNVPI